MRTGAVIGRIEAQCPGFGQVGHALTSAATLTYPAALVSPLKVDTGPPALLGVHSQKVVHRFGIYILLPRVQDGFSGHGAADLLDDLRAELAAALPGWTPQPSVFDALAYAGGQLDRYQETIVCWREDFTTTYELRI